MAMSPTQDKSKNQIILRAERKLGGREATRQRERKAVGRGILPGNPGSAR